MKYLSLFSGVGGFELGIENAYRSQDRRSQADTPTDRHEPEASQEISSSQRQISSSVTDELNQRPLCIDYSEIDKYAVQTYEKNWGRYEACDEHAHISEESESKERPQRRQRSADKQGLQLQPGNRTATLCNRCKGHRNYGDATRINPEELPDFDLLVGGFPCQAFSIAGKRKGFDDTRGTLFFDIARILKDKRPRHILLENVKGLLSHDSGKTIQTIAQVLSDLGYRIEWQVLNAKDFGVPQNRERIFIVGHLRGECAGQVFPIGQGGSEGTGSLGLQGSRQVATSLRATDYKGTHNNIREATRMPLRFLNRNQRSIDGDYAYTVDSSQTSGVAHTVDANYYKGVAANQARTGVIEKMAVRRLTPTECERLMSWPDDWTIGSDTQRYKQCGNGVVSNCVQAVIEKMLDIGCLPLEDEG